MSEIYIKYVYESRPEAGSIQPSYNARKGRVKGVPGSGQRNNLALSYNIYNRHIGHTYAAL